VFIEIAADDRGSFRFIAVEVPSTLGTSSAEVAHRWCSVGTGTTKATMSLVEDGFVWTRMARRVVHLFVHSGDDSGFRPAAADLSE